MILQGSLAEDLSHMQNRKPAAFHIFMSTLFHERKMIQENSEKRCDHRLIFRVTCEVIRTKAG